MPAQAIIAALPPGIDLDLNCKIIFEAVDPTTGAPVSNVQVDNAVLRVQVAGIQGNSNLAGAFQLVPGPGG